MENDDLKFLEKTKKSSKNRLSVIILAAGKGTRMKSALPKVLHPVAGIPMLSRVIDAVKKAGAAEVRAVVGYGEKLVRQVVEPMGVTCHTQKEQNGTADAVKSAQPDDLEGNVMIINGDHPLIEEADIKKIYEEFYEGTEALTVVTTKMENPGSFGRVVRNISGDIQAIVEAKDASHDTLKIKEVNTGIYIVRAEALNNYLPLIEASNAQGEYYLTDLVSLCIENEEKVGTASTNRRVAFGVNSQAELAKATSYAFKRKCKRLMDEGVVILDPKSTYIEDSVEVGASSVIYPGVFLKGRTKIGKFCVVEPNCFLTDVFLSDSVQVKAMTHLEECSINEKSVIGPYARIRPGTEVGKDCRVGNFVELKKTKMGDRSKSGHLTYLGDAEIGKDVNIGCGTITCNYAVDKKKYKTTIGDGAFVGSDTQFVAPITVGKNAVIASGSTITKDVPDNALAVARGKQFIKENYVKK